MPVILPFHLYFHPTTRYLLTRFTEGNNSNLSSSGPIKFVTLSNYRDLLGVSYTESTFLVWLNNTHKFYISRPSYSSELTLYNIMANPPPEIYYDKYGRDIAHIYAITNTTFLLGRFRNITPAHPITANWANHVDLIGYDLISQPLTINLYWNIQAETAFMYNLVIKVNDVSGASVSQWQGEPFYSDMYLWRPSRFLITQYKLNIPKNIPSGTYSIEVGFFNKRTREPLKLTTQDNQLQLKPFQIK